MADALTRNLRSKTAGTPQSEPIPGKVQVMNSAGGYAYALDKWSQLERFLVLGTEGGTYYTSERKLTAENMAVVEACLNEDGRRTVDAIVEISDQGLAPRNTQAIYALAVALSSSDTETRQYAATVINKVCRIGTHLFQLADFYKITPGTGPGWDRVMRRAFNSALLDTPTSRLALHAVKYRQREGWTYADILRRSRPRTEDEARNALFSFMLGRGDTDNIALHDDLDILQGYFKIQETTSSKEAARLIVEHRLPWETVSDEFRKDPEVWAALLPDMGVTALVRNLSQMARLGLLKPNSEFSKMVVARLKDSTAIERSRAHPIQFLDASLVYGSGGTLGRNRGVGYTANQQIVTALDKAFKVAFKNVEPSGKRFYLGLDVSGSMGMGLCAGSAAIEPYTGAGAMALVTASTEPWTYSAGFSHEMVNLPIDEGDSVSNVVARMKQIRMGATDCALPMLDALQKGIEVDQFVIYTDNETWAGRMHPSEALLKYRKETGIPAKLAVVGMTSTGFSIADPSDGGMMDFVGFNASTPRAISLFASMT